MVWLRKNFSVGFFYLGLPRWFQYNVGKTIMNHPPVITSIGGINLPFTVMSGKNGIVLPTLIIYKSRSNPHVFWLNPIKPAFFMVKPPLNHHFSWLNHHYSNPNVDILRHEPVGGRTGRSEPHRLPLEPMGRWRPRRVVNLTDSTWWPATGDRTWGMFDQQKGIEAIKSRCIGKEFQSIPKNPQNFTLTLGTILNWRSTIVLRTPLRMHDERTGQMNWDHGWFWNGFRVVQQSVYVCMIQSCSTTV